MPLRNRDIILAVVLFSLGVGCTVLIALSTPAPLAPAHLP